MKMKSDFKGILNGIDISPTNKQLKNILFERKIFLPFDGVENPIGELIFSDNKELLYGNSKNYYINSEIVDEMRRCYNKSMQIIRKHTIETLNSDFESQSEDPDIRKRLIEDKFIEYDKIKKNNRNLWGWYVCYKDDYKDYTFETYIWAFYFTFFCSNNITEYLTKNSGSWFDVDDDNIKKMEKSLSNELIWNYLTEARKRFSQLANTSLTPMAFDLNQQPNVFKDVNSCNFFFYVAYYTKPLKPIKYSYYFTMFKKLGHIRKNARPKFFGEFLKKFFEQQGFRTRDILPIKEEEDLDSTFKDLWDEFQKVNKKKPPKI